MSYIRLPDYTPIRERPKPLTNYIDQMTKYLSVKYPDFKEGELEAFVKDIVKERYKAPTVEAVVHKKEGHSTQVTAPLDSFIVDVIKDNNLSASGSCYYPVSKKEAFLRQTIESKVKERNDFKKIYLNYEAQGMKRESQYFYQNQANAKIFNNAIAGGMNIKQFILGSKAGFNAITSTGRISVKQGYSFIERCIAGNIYLPTIEDAITYVLNHVRHIPEGFKELIEDNILYCPIYQDVMGYLLKSIENYILVDLEKIEPLAEVIGGLSSIEKAYVFYAGCLNNLLKYNEKVMRSWIDSCFIEGTIDPSLYKDIDISEVKQFKDDVLSCILSTNYKRLGQHPEKPGRWMGTKDAAKFNPEGLKEFIYCCRHFTTHFEKMLHVLIPVLRIETTFNNLIFQQKMTRKTVALSDTDSNIFTTQELVEWRAGKVDFSQKSYEMNALVTFIISQCLEHIFGRLASGMGAEGKDVGKLNMKNEFLFPITIITSLGKHYMTIATMQEGSLLPNPRKEIKGINLRSSTYPKLIRDGFEEYIVQLFKKIEQEGTVFASDILGHIASVEREIYRSISCSESVYLQTVSIKRKEEYADPAISQYFYYELWKAVFEEDYGEMTLPNKCFKIPLKNGKKFFKDPLIMESIRINYPSIHDKLVKFIEKNPKRDISSILIPPSKGDIKPFFLEAMNVRAHISQCMKAYYILLESLGIGSVDPRAEALVCDFYKPQDPVI